MKTKILALLLLSSILVSCATKHPGLEGAPTSGQPKLPLVISANTINGKYGDAFQLVEVTFENTSDKWLRLHHNSFLLDGPGAAGISVVVGNDLKDWAEAVSAQAKMDQHNRELIQGGLIIGGSVAAMTSDSPTIANAGALTALGAYGWIAVETLQSSIKNSQGVDAVPDKHVYKPLNVPAKMFLRRWVLFNKTPGMNISKIVLKLETVEGAKDTYVIPLL